MTEGFLHYAKYLFVRKRGEMRQGEISLKVKGDGVVMEVVVDMFSCR
jgi:hypothetical protein